MGSDQDWYPSSLTTKAITLATLVWVTACDGSNQGNVCASGKEACTCYGNGTCDDGLTCASNLCVRLAVGDGSASAGASATGTTIAAGAGNTGSGVPAAGGSGMVGVPASGNAGIASVVPGAGAAAGAGAAPVVSSSSIGGVGPVWVGGAPNAGGVPASVGGSGQSSQPTPVCGDGVLNAPAEQCDPGIAIPNIAAACVTPANADATHPACTLIPGWACGASTCYQGVCGNGIVEGSEACDPFANNTDMGDGCSVNCSVEPLCPTSSGACASKCGDGLLSEPERCDDGNVLSGDGCSASCAIEPDYQCAPSASNLPLHLPMVVRDFDEGGDFELEVTGSNTATTGIVAPQLDVAGLKPFLSPVTKYAGVQSSQSFAQWYNDSAPFAGNTRRSTLATTLTLHPDASGTTYSNRWGALGQSWVAESLPVLHWCGSVGYEDHDAAGNPIPCTYCLIDENESTPQCDPAPEQTDCQTIPDMLRCEKDSSGSYHGIFALGVYDGTPLFFPADSLQPYSPSSAATIPSYYKGSWNYETGKPLHNFAFTTEVRFWFKYDSTQSYRLTFVGDDDAWVFINKSLALDMGGIHTPVRGELNLNADGTASVSVVDTEPSSSVPLRSVANLGLVSGGIYEVAIFHAERQTTGSSYALSMTGFVGARSACVRK